MRLNTNHKRKKNQKKNKNKNLLEGNVYWRDYSRHVDKIFTLSYALLGIGSNGNIIIGDTVGISLRLAKALRCHVSFQALGAYLILYEYTLPTFTSVDRRNVRLYTESHHFSTLTVSLDYGNRNPSSASCDYVQRNRTMKLRNGRYRLVVLSKKLSFDKQFWPPTSEKNATLTELYIE